MVSREMKTRLVAGLPGVSAWVLTDASVIPHPPMGCTQTNLTGAQVPELAEASWPQGRNALRPRNSRERKRRTVTHVSGYGSLPPSVVCRAGRVGRSYGWNEFMNRCTSAWSSVSSSPKYCSW